MTRKPLENNEISPKMKRAEKTRQRRSGSNPNQHIGGAGVATSKELPDPSYLRQILDYNADKGTLTWRGRSEQDFLDGNVGREAVCKAWNTRFKGKSAGTTTPLGYREVALSGAVYLAHRLIWKMQTGQEPRQIDHVNGRRDDNRWSNLRDVSHSENQRNKKRPKNNTSGTVGVSWQKAREKWCASITHEGKTFHLGAFSEKAEAIAVRQAAERILGFHSNHGRDATGSPQINQNNCEHWRHVSDVLKAKVDAAIAARNGEVAETYHAMLIEHECRKPGA